MILEKFSAVSLDRELLLLVPRTSQEVHDLVSYRYMPDMEKGFNFDFIICHSQHSPPLNC